MSYLNPYTLIDQSIKFVGSLYTRFEDFLTKNEDDADVKVKKKIMIYHFTILFGHFTLLLFSPYASYKLVLFHYLLWVCNFTIIKTRSYKFLMTFFLITFMLGLFSASLQPENALKVIGLALVQHNNSFLMYNNKYFKPFVIGISLVIVYQAQNHLTAFIDDNNIEKILDTIKRLQYAWAPLYLFNQFCAMHFARNYAKALEQTKEAYGNLEKSNRELNEMNQKLKNTLSLLEEKNKELNAAIKTRELFIAGVSHEFRNPLNSLLGNIELLSLEIKDPKWREMLNTCKICGDVLLGLMNNILDVAKINAEKLELSVHSVNFYRLIETVWTVSAIKMREKGLKGQLSLAGNLPQYLEVDSHRLNQILWNVIGNATKFTTNGFIKVHITWHKNEKIDDLRGPNNEFLTYSARQQTDTSLAPRVLDNNLGDPRNCQTCLNDSAECPSYCDNSASKEMTGSNFTSLSRQISKRIFSTKTLSDVRSSLNQIVLTEKDKCIETVRSHHHGEKLESLRKQAGILKIEVIDTGCGIPAPALDKLFQPFSQADSSITRRFGGTGLGLYISKQLVDKMGGQMYAYSEEHSGTDFCILIPTQSASAQEINGLSAREAHALDKRAHSEIIKALVVDDIQLNQTFMLEYLKKMNIEADVANNGAEAVERFKEKGFGYYSCIFMDIQMPIMDGMTASKKIRKYEMKKNVQFENRIPIIMVTGNCTEMEKNDCLNPEGEIKASYFFRKPFVFEECKSCVKNILNRRAENKKLWS